MRNNDLSRMLPKDKKVYYDIRVKCPEISKKLGRRVTIQEFLVVASERLLKEKNLETLFEKEVPKDGTTKEKEIS